MSPEPSRVVASAGAMRTLRYRAMKITGGCRRSLGCGIARHFARQVVDEFSHNSQETVERAIHFPSPFPGPRLVRGRTLNHDLPCPADLVRFCSHRDRPGSRLPTPGPGRAGHRRLMFARARLRLTVLFIALFAMTWDDAGYYSGHRSPLNAFQLQLIDRSNGDFDVVMRYEDINWTTGDASGGSGGLGGSPARAGSRG